MNQNQNSQSEKNNLIACTECFDTGYYYYVPVQFINGQPSAFYKLKITDQEPPAKIVTYEPCVCEIGKRTVIKKLKDI